MLAHPTSAEAVPGELSLDDPNYAVLKRMMMMLPSFADVVGAIDARMHETDNGGKRVEGRGSAEAAAGAGATAAAVLGATTTHHMLVIILNVTE
ncbi:MAG: hypothetical protein WDW38_005011 [Sanguina aurantia]